ncbi:hypothetical protein MP228_001945 [Amoeboaphelidium protococcarum]|nr:hypothetical protein MP228_001945 [Amoeboaphelidium protococcarum]
MGKSLLLGYRFCQEFWNAFTISSLFILIIVMISMGNQQMTLGMSVGSVMDSQLSTENFVISLDGSTESHPLAKISRKLSLRPTVSKDSPILFFLKIFHKSDVARARPVWSMTNAGVPFIQIAVGDDKVGPGNGEYRIMQNTQFITTHQTIDYIGIIPAGKQNYGLASDSDRIVISGQLSYSIADDLSQRQPRRNQRSSTASNNADESSPFIAKYTVYFTESHSNELQFSVNVHDVNQNSLGNYDRIMLTYSMGEEEEVFGLGEQFSYWSLKGQRVPIISREQGIGRGRQPLTYILNHVPPKEPSYAGADALSTYTAIAHYITSQSRSVYLHNSELSIFDFTVKNRCQIEVVSLQCKLSLFYAKRPLELIDIYTQRISGRQSMLPDWINGKDGAVVGIQGGEGKVFDVVNKLQSHNVKVAAVWLQDWVGTREQPINLTIPIPFLVPGFPDRRTATINIQGTNTQKRLWWNWENDRKLYPSWKQFISKLYNENGVRVMAYINPFLTNVERGGKDPDSFKHNYFKEASEKGYLVQKWVNKSALDEHHKQQTSGQHVFNIDHSLDGEDWKLVDYLVTSGPGVVAGMVDLSNPQAFEWFKNIIKKNMLENGVKGWMADFAEYMPLDGVIWSQLNQVDGKIEQHNPQAFHNIYPREWARLNAEAVKEMNESGNDVVFFMRSAYSDSAKYCNSFWNGDQLHTWDLLDGLESTIFGSLNAGLSGIANVHSDIGGYTTINVDPNVRIKVANKTTIVRLPIIDRRLRLTRQDSELFYRWMETAVFTSTTMYRTHEGSVPEENMQVWSDDAHMKAFAHFTGMFSSLMDHRKLLQVEHQLHGYPILRSLYLHYPYSNKGAMQMERLQFMYGPLLLIVPVTSPGIQSLNQQISEPKPDDDPNLLQEDEMELDNQSSDEEDSLIQQRIMIPNKDGKHSAKGRLISNVRYWATESVLSTARVLLRAFQINGDAEQSAIIQMTEPVNVNTPLSKSAPQQFSRRPALDDPAIPDPIVRSMSPQKQFQPPSGRKAPHSAGRRRQIVAPKEPPQPRHGRPYLPTGTWKYLWTGDDFDVQDPSGLFITNQLNKTLPCPVGKSGVFIRSISEQQMKEIITNGMSNNMRSKGGEDWRYWLDSFEGDSNSDLRDGPQLQHRMQDIDQLVERAMRKYYKLRESLKPFLEYTENNQWSPID